MVAIFTKMMFYNDLDTRTIRERADMSQLWATWIVADDLRRHSFRGSLAMSIFWLMIAIGFDC